MDTNQTPKSNNKKGFLTIIGFLVLVIVLAFTNPDEAKFREYLRNDIASQAQIQGGIEGAIDEMFSGVSAWFTSLNTDRKNYFILSRYKVTKMDGTTDFYIGIFNYFFEL